MKNYIIILLFITLLPQSTHCMKRDRHRPNNWHKRKVTTSPKKTKVSQSIIQSEQELVLPIEIIEKICIGLFRRYQNPLAVKATIGQICAINKQFCACMYNPNFIRTILNNVANCPLFDWKASLANQIKTKPIQNYLLQSISLNLNIQSLDEDQIRESIRNGADINYCNSFVETGTLCEPILRKIENDYNKTKLLLELGANPYLTDRNDQFSSAFGRATKKGKSQLLELYISYYPDYPKKYS
jgi:hypothetical protein